MPVVTDGFPCSVVVFVPCGQMATVGGELVGGELGVVLDETTVGVTFVDSPSLETTSLNVDSLNNDLTVCQYILPHDVTVAGFEEVVEEVELGATSWDNLNKSSSSSSSLSQDSRISTDPSPDVFFTLIEETVAPAGLLASSPGQEGGEVIVEKIYEMKDELCFTEGSGTPEIKVEPIETVEHEVESEEQVIETMAWIKEEKADDTKDEIEVSALEVKKGTRVRVVAYQCSDCNTHFTDEADFKAHMEAHLVKLQNSCALCNTEFETKSELQEHIKEHFSKSSTHTCHICNQNFMTKSGLKRHRKQLHNLGSVVVLENTATVKCGHCQEIFSDRSSLRQHATIHASKKPFSCDECGATFTQNGSLQVHLRRHRGEKPFTCQLCGNSFTRAHSLKVHMKTHTGEKPFACEYCGACFVTSSHLTVHRRTHTGERPYSCSDCGATFITTSHLNVHRRVHAGGGNIPGTPVGCTQCQASFSDPAQLRHHRRTQHRSTQPQSQITCKVCDKRFPNHRQLNNHMVHECG